jgi:hypothetical protein
MRREAFVSYSSPDREVAEAVVARLEAEGVPCWVAPRDVRPGANYAEEILGGIAASRVMVLVLSSHANLSPHVAREVERAVSLGLPIVPLRVEGVLPSKALVYFLGTIHWLDALTPPLDPHLARLAGVVRGLLGRGDEGPGRAGASRPAGAGRRGAGPWAAPAAVGAVGGAAIVAATFLGIGPPWPGPAKLAALGALVLGFAVLGANRGGPAGRLGRAALGALAPALLATYLALSAAFVYDAPTPDHQEAAGFRLRPTMVALLRESPSTTVEELVKGSEYNPNEVWEPWSVAAVRLALLASWLGVLGVAAALATTLLASRCGTGAATGRDAGG